MLIIPYMNLCALLTTFCVKPELFCISTMLLVFDVFFQAPLLCSLEGLQFYLPIAEAIAKVRFVPLY